MELVVLILCYENHIDSDPCSGFSVEFMSTWWRNNLWWTLFSDNHGQVSLFRGEPEVSVAALLNLLFFANRSSDVAYQVGPF